MKRALPLLLAAVIAAGCGSDDGDEGDRTETAPSAGLARFASPRIPFTFEYPKDSLKRVQVRRTSRSPLPPRRYLDEFKRDLEGEGRTVTTREEKVGDRAVGVLFLEHGDVTSLSYFFTGDGQTWQVECIADEKHRSEIEAACRTALESVEFSR